MQRIISLLLALAVIPGMVAASQVSKTPVLPSELVERLLGLHGVETELVVGAIPDRLKGVVPIPAGATIDATMRRPGHHSILFTMAGSPAAANDTLVKELVRNGWARNSELGARVDGGFVNRPQNMADFCREGRRLNFHLRRGPNGKVLGTVNLIDLPMNRDCSGAAERPWGNIELPALHPPSKVRLLGTSGGGGTDYRNSTIDLETELSLADLVSDFDTQILEQGWTRSSNLDAPGAVLSVYRRTDDAGNEGIAILSGVSMGGSYYQLSLRGVRPRGGSGGR
jgi:hypothetical protein